MNPYSHHPSLSGSPHHAPGGPHHGYSTGGGGGGNVTTTTPDPSPHSPPYGSQPDSGAPYTSLQSGQGMGSNGHHHGPGNMMGDQPHHQSHNHPHLSGHLPYPPVNHNNNCTLKVSLNIFLKTDLDYPPVRDLARIKEFKFTQNYMESE